MGAFSVFFLRLILSILLALLIGRVFFRGDSIVKVIALAGVMLVLTCSSILRKGEKEDRMGPKKFVFSFEEGDGKNKKLLGGKGANLCEMTQIGLPVPPGFVISTEACLAYLAKKRKGLPPQSW